MGDKKERLGERLNEMEEEYSKTQSNKATHKHLGILKSKIAQIKKDITEASKRQKGKGFFVKKSGDGTVALVGFPSAGKSSLINALTGIESKTAQYAFTTTEIIPAIMIHKDAHIQIFDLPGLIEEAHRGAGGGNSVLSAIKSADLLVFVISVDNIDNLRILVNELEAFNIHINRKAPRVRVNRTERGGGVKIEVNLSGMDDESVKEIFKAVGEYNASVQIWDRIGERELVSLLAKRSVYINGIVALNKIDLERNFSGIAEKISKAYGMKVIPISATNGTNLNRIKDEMYSALGLIRIWLKPRSRMEKMAAITVKRGTTVGKVARAVHTEIVNNLKCAYVKGESVSFANQKVGENHVLEDEDIVTFIT